MQTNERSSNSDNQPCHEEPDSDLRALFDRAAPPITHVDVDQLLAVAATSRSPWPSPIARDRASDSGSFETSTNPNRRRLIVTAKITASVLFLTGIVSTVLLLNVAGTNSVLADVQKALKKVRSATYTVTQTVGDKPSETTRVMLLGNLARAERPDGTIFLADSKQKKMVQLIPSQSKAIITEGLPVPKNFSVLERLSILHRSAAEVQPGVPERDFNGKKISGFVVDTDGGKYSVWVDPEIKLPLRMERTARIKNSDEHGVLREQLSKEVWSDFVFNRKLDKSLFNLTPPKGYKVEVRTAKNDREEQKRRNLEQLQKAKEIFEKAKKDREKARASSKPGTPRQIM